MLVKTLLNFTLLGAEWVLWLMIVLSVVSLAMAVERIVFFASNKFDADAIAPRFNALLVAGDIAGARKLLEDNPSIESTIALAGLDDMGRGVGAVEETVQATAERLRKRLDRNLVFLGTVGSNAPFIGLFGTVLGIIKAFKDLASNTSEGSQAVLAGISEALVATAVGLLVAIPAVIAFNYFNKKVKGVLTNANALTHAILAHLKADAPQQHVTPMRAA